MQMEQLRQKQTTYDKMEKNHLNEVERYLKTKASERAQMVGMEKALELKQQFLDLQRFDLETTVREANTALRERVAILERAKQVEGKAYQNVDAHLRSLQDEVLALKEEIAFYRGIVSAGKEKGLNIQTFVLDKEASPGAYRFQLVLTQNLKRVRMISGKVKLKIMDELDGRSKELLVSDMNGKQADYLKFEFKFFQRIEGRFTLPDGFRPERLQVEVVSSGKRRASVEKSFEWRGLAS